MNTRLTYISGSIGIVVLLTIGISMAVTSGPQSVSAVSVQALSAEFQSEDIQDEAITFFPEAAVSVKYLLEHRSAFDGQDVSVQGRVVETKIGERLCLHDKLCGRGQVILGVLEHGQQVAGYRIIVITAGGVSPRDFPAHEYVELTGTVQLIGDVVYLFRMPSAASKVARTYSFPQ